MLKQLSSKHLILWMVLMLVGLFITGMWALSSLNLSYSESSISTIRKKQIQSTFKNNFEEISQTQRILEFHVNDLYQTAKLLVELKQSNLSVSDLEKAVKNAILNKFVDAENASAVGIWFEKSDDKTALNSYYAFKEDIKSQQVSFVDDLSSIAQQKQRLDNFINDNSTTPTGYKQGSVIWTPAYYNASTDSAVLTLLRPVYDEKGLPVAIVAIDWNAKQIIDLIGQVTITPNTFALLLDKNQRKLSSLSRLVDEQQAQRIIDAVMQQDLTSMASDSAQARVFSKTDQQTSVKEHQFEVAGQTYALYVATTPAQMLFAVGVPKAEIDAVIDPMRKTNQTILIAIGSVTLLIAAFLIYRIILLMKELQTSYTDSLTGLPNRGRLRSDLSSQEKYALILINIDQFKVLNNVFGGGCGDVILKTLSDDLLRLSEQQTPRQRFRLYRFSGDEFIVLGQGWNPNDLNRNLDRLNDFLQQRQIIWQDQKIDITVTMGAAVVEKSSHHGEPADFILSQASIALETARSLSKDYNVFSEEQDVRALFERNLEIAKQVKTAIEQDKVVPWFQPIVRTSDNKTTKFECLIRMFDSHDEVLSPGVFLPIASELRQDNTLTKIMIDKAFRKFADLPYQFSLNLSYRDITDKTLTHFIIERLEEFQLGERLIFEILESDGIDNYEEVGRFVNEVKAFGCQIAIDDFGSGYSNFEHLIRLKVDLIKIDGSLIRNIDTDDTSYRVTKGVVDFAHNLNIKTVAEFVHNEAVYKQVKKLGIDYAQGAFFSMPQPDLTENNAK